MGDSGRAGGRLALHLALGATVLIALIAGVLWLVHWASPGVWTTITNDQGLADIVISSVATLIGSGLAVLVAYAVLRAQMVADRTLAFDVSVAEIAHDVAGELAAWVDGMTEPRAGRADRLPGEGAAVMRALVSRKDLLSHNGVASVPHLIEAVRQLERDRVQLILLEKSIGKRLSEGAGDNLGKVASALLHLSADFADQWSERIQPVLDEVKAHSRTLSEWRPGQGAPHFEFTPGTRVDSVVEIDSRLREKGLQFPRDEVAEAFGFYDDSV